MHGESNSESPLPREWTVLEWERRLTTRPTPCRYLSTAQTQFKQGHPPNEWLNDSPIKRHNGTPIFIIGMKYIWRSNSEFIGRSAAVFTNVSDRVICSTGIRSQLATQPWRYPLFRTLLIYKHISELGNPWVTRVFGGWLMLWISHAHCPCILYSINLIIIDGEREQDKASKSWLA